MELDKLDLNLLRTFNAIHRHNSLSAAAVELGLTQPAISAALKRLRAHFDNPLFVRTSHGMEPTPRALTLISPTRDILQRIHSDVLASEVFNPATTSRKFTIALSDIGEMTFLPKVLDRFQRDAPGASVASVSMTPLELNLALENGEVDLAVGYFPDLKNRNLFQQRLFSHDFICLLRADHPIRSRKISMEQFLKLGHAVIKAEGRSQELFEQLLIKQKIQRRIVLSTPHFMSIPFLIASSDLLVTVPRAVGASFAQFSNIRLVEPPLEIPTFDLRQHWHRKYHKDGANVWLRSILAEMFSGD